MPTDLDALREQLLASGLSEADLDPDPVVQFQAWFRVAEESGVFEPSAMTLATVDEHGGPDARVVLLRGVDEHGFHWYTDRESAKGHQLAATPRAALVVAWPVIARQVRVVGVVAPCSDEASDGYWALRPRGSQLAAVTSRQSRVLADRAQLDDVYDANVAAHEGRDVPRPTTWGGYTLVPERVEFWQQRPFRMHDRLRYERAGDGWTIVRLSP